MKPSTPGRFLFCPKVFSEVVYVLTKVYGIERSDVADSMIELLDFVSTTATEIMKTAFQNYRETNLDFVDCILAAYAISDNQQILSFDKKLNNFIARKKAENTL